jgi:hypothetical protein
VAEDEAPRHRRGAHEVEREQRVERDQALVGGELGDRRGEIGLERLAGGRGPVQHGELGGRERRELAGERGRDGHGHAGPGLARVCAAQLDRRRPAGARKLLQVEGVAAAVAVDGGSRACIEADEQLAGVRLAELVELDRRDRRSRERGAQAR